MAATEIPVVFECEGQQLIGMVHRPEQPRRRGLLTVVAGGPQYRGGVCRMQVQLARELAEAGVPVMRFDYRGMGDSEGEFRGFQHVGADLKAAVETFRAQVPGLEEVALFGGCDAASAAMINGWHLAGVTGLVLGNPWVHSTETSDAVTVKHYGRRLQDKDFWLKLIRGQYNPWPAVVTVGRAVLARLRRLVMPTPAAAASPRDADDSHLPFEQRMCKGLARFRGDVMMLMSGRSLLSKEFDELVASRPDWQQAMRSPRSLLRHDLPEGDQAFSTIETRREVNRLVRAWMLGAAVTPQEP